MPDVWPHHDFRFHRRITQVGCYWRGGGHTELYLIEGDRLVMVDTGVSSTPIEYIEPALRSIGRSLRDVGIVLNTHGHHDHAGGNHAVWSASNCEVWIHQNDVAITQDASEQFEIYFARNQRLTGQTEHLDEARVEIRENAGPPAPISRLIRDGEVLELGHGIDLRVVNTPGHTMGCCTFVWEREGIAIAGDSVLGKGSRDGGLPLIFYPAAYRQTLARFATLDVGTMCLGHHYKSIRQTNESIRFGNLVGAFINEAGEVATIIEESVGWALHAHGKDAPFVEIARVALDRMAMRMPIGTERGPAWPNGAIAAVSAFWGDQTGRA